MNTRYKNICDLFYSSHYISIAYYHKRKLSYSTGYPDIPLPYDTVLSRTSDSRITVDIYSSDSLGYYGIIGTPDMDDLFLIGPVFSLTISSQAVRDYMHELCIPLECFQTVFEFLRNIPLYSYNQFLHLTNFTQTSHIKKGVCTLKNQYFSAQNSNQAAFSPYSRASCMYFGSL